MREDIQEAQAGNAKAITELVEQNHRTHLGDCATFSSSQLGIR